MIAVAAAPLLKLTDRCDRCGAQAFMRATRPDAGEVLFCAHHGRLHAAALARNGWDLEDESHRVNEKPN